MELTNKQWEFISPILDEVPRRSFGRPRKNFRDVLNGILWILRTGAPWKDLSSRYPSYQTCHRYFQNWQRQGTIEKILRALAEDLHQRGRINLEEAFIDGSFSSAKKGDFALGRPNAERAVKSWQLQSAGQKLLYPI